MTRGSYVNLVLALLLNTHTIILETVTYSHARGWLQGELPYSPPYGMLIVCRIIVAV
ncbi:hypothetical protein Hanom_Chr17g01586381 [Helianthus anomalus]